MKPKHLRAPVGDAGEHAEHHAADDDVVEVGDQEQAVVQHEVGWPGPPAVTPVMPPMTKVTMKPMVHSTGECEVHATAEHGEQPVEDLHAGRDRDDHRRDAEEGVDVGTRAHGEEVVQPHDERQHGDGEWAQTMRRVTEQRFCEKVA